MAEKDAGHAWQQRVIAQLRPWSGGEVLEAVVSSKRHMLTFLCGEMPVRGQEPASTRLWMEGPCNADLSAAGFF